MSDENTVYLAIAAVIVILAGIVLLMAGWRVPSSGTIVTVGCAVYEDQNATIELASLPWGYLRPGEIKNQTVYIKNTELLPATLSFNTSAWDPPIAEQYLTLVWDYNNTTLYANDVLPVTFTLQVGIDVQDIQTFNFDLTIWITEKPS